MFSSTDSTAAANPLPQLPVPSSTFHGGNNQILLPQIQDHYLCPYHLFPSAHMVVSANNNNVNGPKGAGSYNKPLNNYVFPSRPKKGIKKDRHTKILTAQGPRDRRVRLSICIARKFFDLQDMLGFDKPSKTLNWLFAKSKLAIEELIHTSSPSSTTDAEMAVKKPIKEDGGSQEMGKKAKNSLKDDIGVTDLAKDSRAKARARARARTVKKMCIKELSEAKMLLPEPCSLTETCKKPVSLIKSPLHKDDLTIKQVPPKESITPRFLPVVDKKMKPCSVWDIPQHLMMPKDWGFGDNNGYSHNAENWNDASTIMCSTLCAAMSGVSPSQVLQICRKSWDCSDHNYQN